MNTDVQASKAGGAERSEAPIAGERQHKLTRSADGAAEPCEAAAGAPAGDPSGALPRLPCSSGDGDQPDQGPTAEAEPAVRVVVRERMKLAGEWMYNRGRCDHPSFRCAPLAASNLLGLLPPGLPLLVMRDPCLLPLRELALEHGFQLLLPDKAGGCVWRVPRSALFAPDGQRVVKALRVEPLPRGSEPYAGPAFVAVVACLAFAPSSRRLCSFDGDRTAEMLEKMWDGLSSGFRLRQGAVVLAMASDCQEIGGLPGCAFGFAEADLVVTPTRIVKLGAGECVPLPVRKEETR